MYKIWITMILFLTVGCQSQKATNLAGFYASSILKESKIVIEMTNLSDHELCLPSEYSDEKSSGFQSFVRLEIRERGELRPLLRKRTYHDYLPYSGGAPIKIEVSDYKEWIIDPEEFLVNEADPEFIGLALDFRFGECNSEYPYLYTFEHSWVKIR